MFATERVKVWELKPGDCYLWSEIGCEGRTTREVLAVVASRPFGDVLLEVRRADGNVTRSFLGGAVDVVRIGEEG